MKIIYLFCFIFSLSSISCGNKKEEEKKILPRIVVENGEIQVKFLNGQGFSEKFSLPPGISLDTSAGDLLIMYKPDAEQLRKPDMFLTSSKAWQSLIIVPELITEGKLEWRHLNHRASYGGTYTRIEGEISPWINNLVETSNKKRFRSSIVTDANFFYDSEKKQLIPCHNWSDTIKIARHINDEMFMVEETDEQDGLKRNWVVILDQENNRYYGSKVGLISNKEYLKAKPFSSLLEIIKRSSSEEEKMAGFRFFCWEKHPNVYFFDFNHILTMSWFMDRISDSIQHNPGIRSNLSLRRELFNQKRDYWWSGHDLQVEELANFFNEVEGKKELALTPHEEMLRDTLLENGIISGTPGKYKGNEGAIIGISRSSSLSKGNGEWSQINYKRVDSILHGARHGLWFTNANYRKICQDFWEKLTEEQRKFFQLTLCAEGFKGNEQRVIVNEFQAHILSLPNKYEYFLEPSLVKNLSSEELLFIESKVEKYKQEIIPQLRHDFIVSLIKNDFGYVILD